MDFMSILNSLAGQMGALEGVQGPPVPDGMLPKRTAPIGGGFDLSMAGPILQGLMGGQDNAKPQLTPQVSAPGINRGGAIIGPEFPGANPASIRNRL